MPGIRPPAPRPATVPPQRSTAHRSPRHDRPRPPAPPPAPFRPPRPPDDPPCSAARPPVVPAATAPGAGASRVRRTGAPAAAPPGATEPPARRPPPRRDSTPNRPRPRPRDHSPCLPHIDAVTSHVQVHPGHAPLHGDRGVLRSVGVEEGDGRPGESAAGQGGQGPAAAFQEGADFLWARIARCVVSPRIAVLFVAPGSFPQHYRASVNFGSRTAWGSDRTAFRTPAGRALHSRRSTTLSAPDVVPWEATS